MKFNGKARASRIISLLILACVTGQVSHAQEIADGSGIVQTPIAVTSESPNDDKIKERITQIYAQIDELDGVVVRVAGGVVLLSGAVSNQSQAERALGLARRLQGVVTVDDNIKRQLDVQGNVLPLVGQIRGAMVEWLRALPLIAVALTIFLIVAYLGHLLAKWSGLWNKLLPNTFLAELVGQAIRIVFILLGLVLALNLIGATTLMGTILGGAGVAGLAIGFAVRDSIENYISSIMLSLRQPFRANEHVVINDHEGIVIKLTSRATVLMTLDGNHLRIPNSTVFKGIILNYSRNPERRFEFDLGVDADDDPVTAMQVGLEAIDQLEFVLKSPNPKAIIITVGDSNIVVRFMGWVDQRNTDFGKARSMAIRAAKTILEEKGFTLPEPIYRLRIDQLPNLVVNGAVAPSEVPEVRSRQEKNSKTELPAGSEALDVSPDTHLVEKVNVERALGDGEDLLSKDTPSE